MNKFLEGLVEKVNESVVGKGIDKKPSPKIILVCVVVLAFFISVSIASRTVFSPASKFKSALNSGDFQLASELYQENGQDTSFCNNAEKILIKYINHIKEDYVNEGIDKETAESSINAVSEMTEVNDALEFISTVSASKAAMKEAAEASENGDYYTALAQYEKIVPEDEKNYSSVDSLVKSAKEHLCQGALSDAENAEQNGDFELAVETLMRVKEASYGTQEIDDALLTLAQKVTETYSEQNEYAKAYALLGTIDLENSAEFAQLKDSLSKMAAQSIAVEAKKLIEQKQYSDACNILSSATGDMCTDEIRALSEACKAQYRAYTAETAEAYANNGQYSEAVKAIDAYLKQFSDDELKTIRSEYNLKKLEAEQLVTVEKTSVRSSYIYNQAFVTVKNQSDQVLKSYLVAMIMLDANGYPVNNTYSFDQYDGYGNVHAGRADSVNVQPGGTYGGSSYWNIEGDCASVLACVVSAEFYDGTKWDNPYYDSWVETYAERPVSDFTA